MVTQMPRMRFALALFFCRTFDAHPHRSMVVAAPTCRPASLEATIPVFQIYFCYLICAQLKR